MNVDMISKLFAKEVKRKISDKPRLPFSMFASWEYEGQLKKAGDTVTVPVFPKITMNDVSSNNTGNIKKTSLDDIDASDRNITSSSLTIDKLHTYREKFSTLEEVQTAYLISGNRMQDMRLAIDTVVELGIIQSIDAMLLANSGNVLTATEKLTENNIAKELMSLRTAMSKKEIPMDNRILVVSPEISALIAMAKILNGTDDGANALIEGWLGKFAGFRVFESNLIEGTKMYGFRAKSYNAVRQSITAKITEAPSGDYFNIIGAIAHGEKVFDQNIEQIVQLKDKAS